MFDDSLHDTRSNNGPGDDVAVESEDQLTFELNIREFAFEDRNDEALRFDLPVVGRRNR
ncbi:MAG: hypothetical protein GF399_02205 [Candidatus Coatesbacteria bacterium]|nr:hypothetical protein [Candidatus Coatesbacteria bacterium]